MNEFLQCQELLADPVITGNANGFLVVICNSWMHYQPIASNRVHIAG